ncbi:MAG: hypothetical protein KJN95_07130 [Gammaproteobacteria bacterium]|nr:hypothetical protein [Gammaproteobacteria bacterium]
MLRYHQFFRASGATLEEQLASPHYLGAGGIIRLTELIDQASDEHSSVKLPLYSSVHWLEAKQSISIAESSAHNYDDREESDHG